MMFKNTKMIIAVMAIICSSIYTSTAQIITPDTFGKGIKFQSKDSTMSMKFNFRMQNLFDGSVDQDGNYESSFTVRRARLKFSGHAFSPKITYKAELGLSNGDISTNKEDGNGSGASRIILDAVVKYQFQKHWNIWIGQTKLPGNRERVISSANLQFVDRSNLNSKFNIDRDMGLQLHGEYNLGKTILQPKFAWTMGEGRDITSGNYGGYNYTGRLDFLPLGAFEGKKEDYNSSDLQRQSKPKIAIGITYNYNQGAVRQQGQLGSFVYALDSTGKSTGEYAENDLKAFQADLIFKYKGISLLTEYANTVTGKQMSNISKDYNTGSAFNIQAGYLFKSNYEIAGRYTTITPDDLAYSGITQVNEYTLGFSKYIVGHSLKVQTDFSWIDDTTKNTQQLCFRFQVEMQL